VCSSDLTLIAEYEDGGLKILEFVSFLKAQKAMWVKRLLTADMASWKVAPLLYLDQFLGKNTFKCNMEYKVKPKNFPHFYWQVIQSWCEIKEITDVKIKGPIEVRREILWLNKRITIKKKVIKWGKWQKKGINMIHDIVDENGNFLNINTLQNKYDIKCNMMDYNTLKDSIPAEWRKSLKSMKVPVKGISINEEIFIKINNQGKGLNKITNKDLYWILVKKLQIKPIFTEKLQQELGIKEEEWKSIFKRPRCIIHTKIRVFQYKLLFSLLPCNKYLKQIARSDTDKCNECHKLDDTAHYMFECPKVVPFWNSFMDWWNALSQSTTFLDKKSAFTGFSGKQDKVETLNACLLIAKWHVYKSKINESEIFFYNFLRDFKYNIDIEKTIAIKNDKIEFYTIKWQLVEEYIT
jgi:hypothetical protein